MGVDTKPKKYNVLMVLSDQHNPSVAGHEGDLQVKTPHMDRLAEEGVRFRHAYAQNPICTPSRVSILSGQYCHNHGYYGLGGPTPERLPNLFAHFRSNGYRTAGIGKLHLPDDPVDWVYEDCDFWADCQRSHRLKDSKEGKSAYYRYLEELGLRDLEDSNHLPEVGDQKPGKWIDARPSSLPFEHSPEGWAVKEAIGFMDSCKGMPFFAQVSFPRPHHALTPAKEFWDMYTEDIDLPETFFHDPAGRPPHFRRMHEQFRQISWPLEPSDSESGIRRVWRGYLGCISHCDHALGQLLDYLRRTGKDKDTIVIYAADHGGYMGTMGVQEKAPGICSEAVCRVPFIWRVPGLTPPDHCSDRLVETVDMAATLPSLCGLPEMDSVDGDDISALLEGKDVEIKPVAVTENPWSRAIRWENWRFVHYQRELFEGEDTGELYDLKADPTERHNLYHEPQYRETVHEGRRLLLEWLIRTLRVRTVHPRSRSTEVMGSLLAEDGKESKRAGPGLRVKLAEERDLKDNLNYI